MNIFILPLQASVLFFLLFAFSRVWFRAKEGSMGWGMFIFWVLVWTLATVAVVKPELTQELANQVGIGRGVDTVVYVSIVVLFYLNFRLHVLVENLRHEITHLTREIALQSEREGKKQTSS